jgi:hypothetical protein
MRYHRRGDVDMVSMLVLYAATLHRVVSAVFFVAE